MPDPARAREAQDEAPRAAASPVAAAGPAPAAARVLALQRTVGNAATARLLARIPIQTGEDHQHTIPDWLLNAYTEARKARDAYVAGGKKGPITYDPSKRNTENYYGGFDVEYDPSLERLKISLKGAVEFLPGMVLVGTTAVAKEPSPATAAARDAINALPVADRATAVNKWRWSKDTGPDAADEAEFLTKFEAVVEDQWSDKHSFHCTRPYWEDLEAAVKIDVDVHEAAKAATDHMKVVAYKVPKGQMIGQANVTRPGGKTGGAFANVMTVNSSKVEQRKDRLLQEEVTFGPGPTTVDAGSKTRIEDLAAKMPNPAADSTVETPGLKITVKGADDAQRKARYDAIVAILKAKGMAETRIAFADGGTGATAEVVVGTGVQQTSVAHESGHMFGLDDEYVVGTGPYGAGKKTEHTAFVQKTTGLKGAMHAKSDSIMSNGRVVRPQHYATFLDALRVVSGIEEWAFGPGVQAVNPRTGWDDRSIWGEPMGPF